MFTILMTLVACGKSNLVVRNNEPAAEVIYPRPEDSLVEGYTTTLLGTVSDTNDHPEELVASWLLGEDELCPAAPVTAEGTSTCDASFERGNAQLTLLATDPDGAEGVAWVDLTIGANQPPFATILSPTTEEAYTADGYVVVEARVGDVEDAPEDLTLAWTEAGEALDLDIVPDTDGTLTDAILLAAGTHTITLTATDLRGATTEASVTIEVADD